MTANNACESQFVCSFVTSTVQQCGLIEYKKTWPSQILPLTCCKDSVDSHLHKYSISRRSIDSESSSLKIRAGLFEEDDDTLTICPKHRFALGVGWRPSTLCSIGWKCTKSKSNLKGTITKEQSIFLKKYYHVLLGIGSGVCSRCRKELVQRMADKENRVEPYPSDSMDSYCNVEVSESANAEFIMEDTREEISQNDAYGEVTQCKQTAQGAKKAALQIDEENLKTDCISMDSMDDCISETVYSQSSQYSEWQDSQESPSRKRKIALNTFLETVDISPVKKTLTLDFDLASERTKNDYVRKAKRIMNSVLGILVPQQESLLEEVLYESNACKYKTLESFSKAYSSMSSWGTQRQILSLLVQDYSYNQLKDYIPDLSRYKLSAARKHAEVVGIGKPVSQKKQFREKATIQQIENFLEFILSPAIMTDSPFGECTYKISSGMTLKVPKIILNNVRTRTVTLYLKYCEETQNTDILSERTYMRLLEAIEPNVRKSMKGLDNFAADGSQAFDNLKSVVETLGKGGKGQEWTEKIAISSWKGSSI
ncbi:unnamed protein product [Mytilus coruscus]|uniref:Uncharacterized protein n=1 Tax=Mytilus coruscus TaxID=42192 RepID=A0A6J8C4K2_MYTCO|nr:unnamed protein product [Mytilus coruscus]